MAKTKILIADDDFISRELLKKILEDDYDLLEAANGQETIDMYVKHENELSLVLLDMMMPEKDGITVLKEIKEKKLLDVPIIFVTGAETEELESYSIKLGAVDYIRKPFQSEVIKARVVAQITLKQNTDYLKTEIEKGVHERTKIIESIVVGLATMVEYRSLESGEHVKRVQDITKIIIEKLKVETNLLDNYSAEDLTYMTYAAALHDIGKVSVRDFILLKPSRFTDEEYTEMKKHSEIGAKMAENFYVGENGNFVKICKEVCLHHHEKWDGTGYPDKLKGEEIPVAARIVCIADSFDAIISKRVYKKETTLTKGLEIIKKDSGIYFDPQIVKIFLNLKKELEEMYYGRV